MRATGSALRRISGLIAAWALSGFPGVEATAAGLPPPLTAETSDVATLSPAGPHRVFVLAGGMNAGANVVDADDKDLKVIGLVPAIARSFLVLNDDASRIFVTETFWSRGNRGTREDVLAVYDGSTLNLTQEIVLPGRLMVVPKPHVFEVSADARLAYVYDMLPASRVHVVDLEAGKVLTSVELPGCALAIPYGARAFATICGDGTVGTVHVPGTGAGTAVFSKPFFDANADPLFESAVVDKTSGEGWFLTFSGKVFPVKLGDAPAVGKPWALNTAAGMAPVGTGVQEIAWRPGGNGQLVALHHATRRLYVLMHTGNFWTHKQDGTEVWVFDAEHHALIRRITLETAARSIAVTQDAAPLLYTMGEDGDFAVIDATTGEKLRKRKLAGNIASVPGT